MKLSRAAVLFNSIVITSALGTACLHAQTNDDASLTVLERGASHKIVQRVTWLTNGFGDVTARTNKYTELATGLHYQDNGEWKESKAEIEILNDGTGAIGSQTGHKVSFKPNLDANGVLEITTPDGKVMRSQIFGLGYYDRVTKQSEIIAIMKDAEGELHGDNEVVYPDAFNGVDADVRFRYTRAGIEQDVILRSQPPKPQDFGLNVTNTQLEVFTEFIVTNEPTITTATIPGTRLTDDKLKFGKMVLGRGRAFPVGEENNGRRSVPTGKMWITVDDRRVLLEAVEYKSVKKELEALPELPRTAALTTKPKSFLASNGRKIPGKLPASTTASKARFKKQSKMASASSKPRDGFVLDYLAINDVPYTSGGYSMVLTGGTYLVSSELYFDQLYINKNVVIKLAGNGGSAGGGTIIADSIQPGSDYTPGVPFDVIFTSKDDDAVGEIIPDSTGSPYPALTGLSLESTANSILEYGATFHYMATGVQVSTNATLKWCNFKGCDVAVFQTSAGVDATLNLWNCKIENGLSGLQNDSSYGNSIINLQNVIFGQCDNPIVYGGDDVTVTAENVTAEFGCDFTYGYANFMVNLTNCIFNHEVYGASTNAVVYDADFSGSEFQTSGNNRYYLAASSIYRDAGTYLVSSNLAIQLQNMTTHSPEDGDYPDTSMLDLGFHYPMLDVDRDGLPDEWEYRHFNNLTQTGTGDYDGDSVTNLDEFQAGTDPNTIYFTTIFAESQVQSNQVAGIVEVINGVPFKKAVLVNSMDFENAIWTSYTSNLTVNLGTTDGVYEVRLGLKGNTAGAEQVWELSTIIRDTMPPLVVITNPVPGTISAPMIQLRGYSPECLSMIRYDITNSLGVVTNLNGYVTRKEYDTNTMGFTTNWFECLDIDLAVGLNSITLWMTDLAGNVTMTNLNYTVNYSTDTVAPSLDVHWPQDGAFVSDDLLLVRGFVNEPTAKVMVKIIQTGISTNINEALVERDGLYGAETVPVGSGTNYLTLTATDAAGNITTTNLSIVKSSVQLVVSPLPFIDMNTTRISVSGTIDTGGYTVWVNGIKTTMSGNDWSASNVPVPEGGTAVVQALAIPNTDNAGNGSGGGAPSLNNSGNPSSPNGVNNQATKEKAEAIRQTVFTRTVKINTSNGPTWSKSETSIPWTRNKETHGYFIHQTQTATGSSSARTDMTWPPCGGCSFPGCYEEPPCAEGTWTATSTVNGVTTTSSGNGLQPPVLGGWNGSVEYVRISDSAQYPGQKEKLTINDNAASQFELFTGGKAGSKRKHLFVATAPADDYSKWYATGAKDGIPAAEITVGEFGKLRADGTARKAFEDNTTHDITVTTPRKYYSYKVTVSKQCLPVKLYFTDTPARMLEKAPCSWAAKLELVCNPGTTNYRVIASLNYNWALNEATNVTATHYGDVNPGCGKIVVEEFAQKGGLLPNGKPAAGIKIQAYYIGCCEDGELNWVQTITTNSCPLENDPPYVPFNDHDPEFPPPYVFQPGNGRLGIEKFRVDYLQPCP